MATFEHWTPAYVALGSNLDDPARQILRAFDALARVPQTRLVLRSPSYRSRPLGPVEQPDFVNAVAGLLTQLDPVTMLRQLRLLESQLGRSAPVVRWGPRLIDLDLLMHGTASIDVAELALPHPGLAERAFVLVPLADVASAVVVPGRGRVSALLAHVDATSLVRIAP